MYVGAVIDITERKRAEREHERLRQLEAELAHMNRPDDDGRPHRVDRPRDQSAARRHRDPERGRLEFLDRDDTDLDEARNRFCRIAKDGMRAGEVIRGLRALAAQIWAATDKLDIDDVIKQVLALTRRELLRHDVVLRTVLNAADRPVMGDRVQLQQVLLNSSHERRRGDESGDRAHSGS